MTMRPCMLPAGLLPRFLAHRRLHACHLCGAGSIFRKSSGARDSLGVFYHWVYMFVVLRRSQWVSCASLHYHSNYVAPSLKPPTRLSGSNCCQQLGSTSDDREVLCAELHCRSTQLAKDLNTAVESRVQPIKLKPYLHALMYPLISQLSV